MTQPPPSSIPSVQSDLQWLKGVLPATLWFGLLLALIYWRVIRQLAGDWMIDEDMGHGFFVPVVALYIVWLKRHDLAACVTNWWGLALVACAAAQLYVATLGVELYLARTSLVLAIAGGVLLLAGTENFKRLILPLVLLLFMVPMPAIIYNQITFPLQILASQVAETSLTLIGIPVLRDGNILELPSQRLSVVEACSGIRSLLSLTFLSLVYGYLFDKRPWMKWALLVVTVPIAIAVNALRVTITGILSEIDPQLAEGFFHTAEGWIVFMMALAFLVIAHRLIGWAGSRFMPKS